MLAQPQIEPKIVWQPIPGSSQEIALDSRCHDTLYTGSRGPGKTDTQLMRFRRRVGLGYGEFWRGIIFDREYKHLDDLVSKSKRWFYKFKNDGAKFLESPSQYKWVWPSGEELLFRVIKKKDDYNNYHGQEYPFIGWNELTKYPTPELFNLMLSCNRSSFTVEKDGPRIGNDLACTICNVGYSKHDKIKDHVFSLIEPIPLETFSTTNSYGPGHNWVKAEFIDPAPYGQVMRKTVRVFNPRTQQDEDITRTRVTIFGSYRENIYLDPVYVAGLDSIKDENIRKSWLYGDWDVVAGGAFDDVWKPKIHLKDQFKIPHSWRIDRSFDWGSTHPFSVGWWAEANGEEATLADGTTWNPPSGTLIQFAEWYGTKQIGTNEGIKLSAKKIAIGIRDIEIAMLKGEMTDEVRALPGKVAIGSISRQPHPGPADNQIRDVREEDVETIEKKMSDVGIKWEVSDKSPGSRRNGLELFRGLLENAMLREGPGLYFMKNCRSSISTIPVLPRDEDHPDDVDSTAEDHPYDMARYRVLKGKNRYAKSIKVKWTN